MRKVATFIGILIVLCSFVACSNSMTRTARGHLLFRSSDFSWLRLDGLVIRNDINPAVIQGDTLSIGEAGDRYYVVDSIIIVKP